MKNEISLPWVMHTSLNFFTISNIVVAVLSIGVGVTGILIGIGHLSVLAFAFLIPYGVLILFGLYGGVRCTNEGLHSWFYGFSSQMVAWKDLRAVTTGKLVLIPTTMFFLQEGEKLWLGSASGALSLTYLFYSKSDLSILAKLIKKNAPQAVLDGRIESFVISDK